MTHYSNTGNPIDFPKLSTIDKLWGKALDRVVPDTYSSLSLTQVEKVKTVFAELIVRECINREQLLGAIARGWCSEKNSHKTMDSDLALAIFDEVERQIKKHFGVEV